MVINENIVWYVFLICLFSYFGFKYYLNYKLKKFESEQNIKIEKIRLENRLKSNKILKEITNNISKNRNNLK